jgi:hypothetical protein
VNNWSILIASYLYKINEESCFNTIYYHRGSRQRLVQHRVVGG